MLLCPLRAETGKGVEHPDGLQPHTVGSSLHKERLARLASGVPCRFDTEQRLRLLVDVALRGVEVFGLSVAHRPRREANDVAEAVADVDGDTILEEVISMAIDQPQLP